MLVFFWHNKKFVGWDSPQEALTTRTIAAAGPQAFAVTYDNYAARDGLCCPSLPPVTITYRWTTTAFQPESTVPPGVYGLNNAYTHAVTVVLRPSSSTPPPVSTAKGANAPWTANSLIITPTSLGAVKNGMTLSQAENAARLPFSGSGDGAYYPIFTSAEAPHLYIRPNGDSNFPACVGAQGDGKGTPTVSTTEGFRLGDTVTKLKAIYGQRLTFTPLPPGGGLSPRAGYVLHEPTGTLIFAVDPTADSTINEIAGSTHPLTPSGCPG
jgi:hypothetical protein